MYILYIYIFRPGYLIIRKFSLGAWPDTGHLAWTNDNFHVKPDTWPDTRTGPLPNAGYQVFISERPDIRSIPKAWLSDE